MGFVLPFALLGSVGLDLAVGILWLKSAHNIAGSSFHLQMTDVVIATCLRLVLVAVFAAMFYRGRRMSLRFPVLWEAVNLSLVVAKGIAFVLEGIPFKEAWLLLGLCSASIGLELVFVAHLRSTAGMLRLPSQHVFLPTAVGAMATMNLAKNPSDPSVNVPRRERRSVHQTDNDIVEEKEKGGDGWLREEEKADRRLTRQDSFYERKRFLSDWNFKVEELREKWGSKVEELKEKMRHRGWGSADGGGVMGGAGREKAPLLLLARMYMQERSAIEELQDVWTRDAKWTEFFLPQYTLFLLYASFVHSSRLEELLLARCESSVHVAHTIFWFLKAFCVEGAGVTPVGVKAIEQMLREVVLRGERPAQAFCEQGWGGDSDEAIRCMELFDSPREEGSSATSIEGCFAEAPAFVHELVKIAAELGAVERHQRTGELRRRLRKVQTRFLPSRGIYVPVGRRRHRVYRIAVEESFSFSTKDRAPYLVTLEVIDFQQRQVSAGASTLEGGGPDRAEQARRGGVNDSSEMGGERVPPTTGGQKFMQMLTPRSLGQSLRGVKAGINRTLTTLKGGVSRESGGMEPGQPLEHVEDPLPTSGVQALPGDSQAPGGLERSLVPGYEPRTGAAARGDQGNRASKSTTSATTRGRGVRENGDHQPPSPTSPTSNRESQGRDGGGAASNALTKPSSGSPSSSRLALPRSGASCADGGATRLTVPEATPESATPDGDGAGDGGDGRKRQEDEDDGRALKLVPPSYSSSDLMGMWSRPSRRSDGPPGPFPPSERLQDPARSAPPASNNSSGGGEQAAAAAAVVAAGVPMSMDAGACAGMAQEDDWAGPGTAAVKSTSPGSRSVGSGAERVDTLLLSRDGNPSSAQRAGYGAAEGRTVPTTAAAAACTGEGQVLSQSQSQSHSPCVMKRRPWGYAELRESREEGLDPVVSGHHHHHVGFAGGGGGGGAIARRARGQGREERLSDLEENYDDVFELEKMEGGNRGEERDDEDTDEDEHAGSTPTVIFKERWRQKEARLRRASRLGQAAATGWRLMPIIVKAGDDLRQEQIASQFFSLAHTILKQSPLGCRAGLRPYDIVATSPDAGVIEAIPDTVSLDALKKNDTLYTTLADFFHRHFGPPESEGFLRARRYFVESLAANCIVTYLLQVKDRHNGNILLDAKGRVIHIDFGFMLANSPGGNFKFESAPFKLTAEFVDLMGGPSSACFKGFREVCVQTFMALRRKMPLLILLIETSSVGNAHLPCFGGRPKPVVEELRARFVPEVHDRAAMAHVNLLIDRSMKSWRTSWYDLYQNYAVGIAI